MHSITKLCYALAAQHASKPPFLSQIIPVYDAKVQARAGYHAFCEKEEGKMQKQACMQFKKESRATV